MNKIMLLLLLNVVLSFSNNNLFPQSDSSGSNRKVAILDVTQRNQEVTQNVYSLEYICRTAGIPYFITEDVSIATHFPMLIVCSDIEEDAFNSSEIELLTNYVNSGGILVAPYVEDKGFFNLFGISDEETTRKHHRLTFIDTTETALRWVNDSLERTISLGSFDYDEVMYSCSYNLTNASPLAIYEDSTIGFARNAYGKGYAYCIGFSFQSMIFVPQVDFDWEAQRTYDNGFEPSSDVVQLFIKGLYAKIIQYAAWKHTAPYDNSPIFIFTHDVDCAAAMEYMNYFADWERANNIHSTYFVATHYMDDSQDTDYYDPYIPQIDSVAGKGFEIGSHSVSHAPDFANFSLGHLGNTRQNYTPRYTNGATTSGSIFGECEVSKNLLELNVGATVASFRPGYLDAPDSLEMVLDTLGYKQSSCYTANDVLTNFPYFSQKVRSSTSSISHVLELPISFSSDPSADMNNDSIVNCILPVFGGAMALNFG